MNQDERLAELLSDAVADVEPADRLHELRARTRVTRRSSRPQWVYVAGGTAAATAAVITAATVLGDIDGSRIAPDPGTQSPASQAPPSQSPPSQSPSGGATAAVYYIGDTPRGPRLFREFRSTDADASRLATEGLSLLSVEPLDPDYRTAWPEGALSSVVHGDGDGDGLIVVDLADASVRERPVDLSEAEAALAVEQVIYTLQAAVQGREPVQFVLDGNPVDQVYGVPTAEPLAASPSNDVLSLVSISDPEEGHRVTGSFVARGVANSYEATVPWQVRRGDTVVAEGFATAEGWMDRLYPWQTEVDVSGLAPGEYTFVASTGDPSGDEGAGVDVDTRTIVVE